MSTDFRALCAELLDEVAARPLILDRELIARARAALAEPVGEPAPPAAGEVREVADGLRDQAAQLRASGFSVTAGEIERAADLLERQAALAAACGGGEEIDCETCNGLGTIDERLGGYGDSNPAATCPDCDGTGVIVVSAASSEKGLSDEVGELIKCLRIRAASLSEVGANLSQQGDAIYFTRAADLLAQRHPAPVPVAERLPDTSDPAQCRMPDGDCWWFDPHADGAWYMDTYQSCYTHWLPFHALPLPSGEVQP